MHEQLVGERLGDEVVQVVERRERVAHDPLGVVARRPVGLQQFVALLLGDLEPVKQCRGERLVDARADQNAPVPRGGELPVELRIRAAQALDPADRVGDVVRTPVPVRVALEVWNGQIDARRLVDDLHEIPRLHGAHRLRESKGEELVPREVRAAAAPEEVPHGPAFGEQCR